MDGYVDYPSHSGNANNKHRLCPAAARLSRCCQKCFMSHFIPVTTNVAVNKQTDDEIIFILGSTPQHLVVMEGSLLLQFDRKFHVKLTRLYKRSGRTVRRLELVFKYSLDASQHRFLNHEMLQFTYLYYITHTRTRTYFSFLCTIS